MENLRLPNSKEAVDTLRREILRGIEDIEQGGFTASTSDAELEAFSDRIIKQGKNDHDARDKSPFGDNKEI
ncbi:MAG: hypothetical protein M3430_20195 [Acidobacteriota bacterium]|nr:hypothetical protein [Acidobacteriota bacterium]